jgi:UDP-N-acetyl-D-glucosamine dehydrogenase
MLKESIGLPADPLHFDAMLRTRQACVGIIGMGYVGLPLMLAAAAAGFRTLGFDIDGPKVEALNAGRSPLEHVPHARIEAARAGGRFEATADFARLGEPDALLICVPTPLGRHQEPDLAFVEATARDIAAALRPGQLVVLESTTWPGTTREVVKPILEATGLRSETDFFLAYSPEREDPGNPDYGTAGIPKVVGGDGPHALALAMALYDRLVVRTVPVSSPEAAEAAKLTENIFRSVNIALVNELKTVFSAMGIDVFEVIGAAATKPFGYMPFWPGPGLGGHCIPIDPFYLTWKAREHGVRTRFIELAGEINTAMPRWVVERTALALDRRTGRGLNGARILLLGVAYKKNIDDVRESPAFALWELLAARGAAVSFHDPHVAAIPRTREHAALAGATSVPLEPAILAAQDAVIVVTDHDSLDWTQVAAHAPLVVDTRDALRRRGLDLGDRLALA